MKGFVAAIAAVSAAALACATGQSGFDVSSDGGEPSGGDSAILDGTIGTESGPDAVADDSSSGSATDGSSVDPPSSDGGDGGDEDASPGDAAPGRVDDAAVDAEAGILPPALGSCDPAAWAVTASISAPNNPPAFAVDGLLPTRWSTGVDQAVGQYFQVDFGGLVEVGQVTLDDSYNTTEATDYPRGVEILGSTDGINFATTLASETYATAPGAIVTMSFAPAAVRAVRMQLTTGVSDQWWSVHELRLGCQSLATDGGGVPDGGSPAPASCAATAAGDAGWTANSGVSTAGWVGSASSTDTSGDTVGGAFDQSSSTRWSSGQAQVGGEWFQVDLGKATNVSGVTLYLLDGNVTDYPSSYALQLSTDNLTFTTVATGLGAATTAICVPRQSARYVKVTQTGTGDPSWWSIYELDVFP